MPIIEFNKETIESNIVLVAAAEKVTKAALRTLSRELIAYVYETDDIAMVNRLLQVLTPVNKRVACLYFPTFIAWAFNEKTCAFGKQSKAKAFNKKYEAACDWLKAESNDIWLWADNEIQMQVKPKNYGAKLTQLVTKALKDEDEGLTAKEILYAILASEEISLADIMAPLNEAVQLNVVDEAVA
jgi:hypothetical protein